MRSSRSCAVERQTCSSRMYGTAQSTVAQLTLARFGLSFSTVPVSVPSAVENRTRSPTSNRTCASSGRIEQARFFKDVTVSPGATMAAGST